MEGMLLAAVLAVALPQAETPRIEIGGDPVVEIGASAADPDDQLFGVGPVLRTSGGEILIVEAAAGRIRVYDARGAFLRDLGRRGEGPGEFREILDAALQGDTVLVLDRGGSVTRMALDGSVIDTRRTDHDGLTDEPFNPVPHGILPDGRVVIRAQERVFGRPDGEYVQEVGWLTVDRTGRVDTLGFFPSHAVRSEDRVPRPYRPWIDADFAAGGGRLWLSVPAGRRLVRPADGLDIEVEEEPRAPTADQLARFREGYLGRGASENDRRVIGEWVDGAPMAERLPPFRDFMVDGLGRLWIERWPGSDAGTTWDVYGGNGSRVAMVAAPLELRLEEAGPDWVAGVWTDPLGVERVQVYSLTRTLPTTRQLLEMRPPTISGG